MRILVLNAYHGGSHKAFIESWINHSDHDWTLLTLPDHHWKWRMRHAAISFNEMIAKLPDQNWDIIFCTDMLNLAEFQGLATQYIQSLPTVIFFHENQLLYPDQHATERDYHYAFSNFISALSANEIWFNSDWHKNTFINALKNWLKKMPDYQPMSAIDALIKKSRTHYPGLELDCFTARKNSRPDRPLTILWAARWEDDKNPGCFFNAIEKLTQKNIDFRLNVIGSSSEKTPDLFKQAHEKFSANIDHWGYIKNRNDYLSVLKQSDVIVSTASHEFFGIAVLEAVSLGCIPVIPDRLAYPETLAPLHDDDANCFYDGSDRQLANILEEFSLKINNQQWFDSYQNRLIDITTQYRWERRSRDMDNDLSKLVTNHCPDKVGIPG